MLNFLFEQYGYYPKDLKENEFEIDNWKFKLIEVECSEDYMDKVNSYIELIRKNFEGRGPYIISNRFNKNISIYDGKKYALISVYKCDLFLEDLNKFHCIFIEKDKTVDLKKLLLTWNERVLYIENNAINSLRIDSVNYENNLKISVFCLGLAQNAIQYLSDIILDYGDTIENVTIAHKRLKNFNSYDFFNPFNFIIDHPVRDLVELYKNDFLTFHILVDSCEYYKLDSKLASIFISRMLYPIEILDLLEDNINKKDSEFRLMLNIEKEIEKIKKVYLYFKEKYNIRPIEWLEN